MTPLERLQWIICFSGFLDLFGVAMLYPLLIHQAKTLGATPGQVGLFGSIYGTLQFFTSPIMGQLSDHVGRRTVLLMSLVGTAVGYILLGMSNSIILMALARVPSGIFKHSQSMSRTYLADISPPQQRASAFGMFNSMSSLGFIVGPTLGGILSTTENGFQRVAMLSSLLFILNACFVYLLIPKYFGDKKMDEGSRITPNKPKFDFLSSLNTFKDVHLIPWHLVWDVFTVRFLMSFSMILYRSNSSSVLAYKFDADARTNGYIISFNGIVSAIAGVLVRWIAPYFSSNSSLNNAFSIILILSLVAITLAPTLFVVVIAMIPLCIASSVLRVTNATAIFNRGGERVRGLVNGLGDTLTSLARALGPAIAGYAQEVSLYGPGIFKHSLSMNRTYLADISPPKQRASFLGMFNSMSSLGFIVGPTLGGILSTTENGFQKVAMLSSSLFIFNACFVYFFIPKCGGDKRVKENNIYNGDNIFDEDKINAGDNNFQKGNSCDRKIYSGGKIDTDRSSSTERNYYFFALNIFRNIRSIPWTRVWDVFVIRFLLSLAMSLFRSNFTSILVYKFQTDPKTNGYILSFNGIISALSGATVKWISLFFNSNSMLQKTFSTVLVFSLLAITFAPSLQMVIASLVPLCIASSVLRVTNVIALYSRGEEKSRGLLNGCRDTLSSISRAIAPLLAGYAQEFSLYGPGLGGSFLAVLATSVAFASPHIKIHID